MMMMVIETHFFLVGDGNSCYLSQKLLYALKQTVHSAIFFNSHFHSAKEEHVHSDPTNTKSFVSYVLSWKACYGGWKL